MSFMLPRTFLGSNPLGQHEFKHLSFPLTTGQGFRFKYAIVMGGRSKGKSGTGRIVFFLLSCRWSVTDFFGTVFSYSKCHIKSHLGDEKKTTNIALMHLLGWFFRA